ncbi:hypothetical protein PYCC9005_000240 [Savitreella phatthalungensis]
MSSGPIEKVKEAAEDVVERVADGQVDSTDTSLRYLGYLSRTKALFLKNLRYVGYTSDIGESFRPVVSSKVVTAGYAISWLYLAGDVGYEGYKAKVIRGEDNTSVGLLAARRSVFQAIATMALPAFTIHTVVKQSDRLFTNVKNPKLKTWGPTGLGLSVVPALPYLFDHPVESVVDTVFDKLEETVFGRASNAESRRDAETKKEL